MVITVLMPSRPASLMVRLQVVAVVHLGVGVQRVAVAVERGQLDAVLGEDREVLLAGLGALEELRRRGGAECR